MDRDRLRTLLTELHRELGSAERLDAESRALVEQVLADVDRLDTAAGQASQGRDDGDLRDLVLKLESEHPRLAAAIGQVADALGRIGI
ncbi:MAG: DUF4404 family protein [Chromatiales bacterium]|jgi:hypothetical protein|nr:DUF4404 family protein [Chromatiales bacterium]